MSNEEYEKKIEFILEQQAQFATSIQEHNERFARNEELVGQIGEHMIQLEDIVNRLAAATLAGFKDVNAKIDALIDSHIRLSDAQARTEETQKQLAASHARLSDAQALTEEAHKRLAEAQTRTDEAQTKTDEAQKRTEEAFARLAEAQARTEAGQALTDEALRRLIATVERHISEGRNGGQKQ